MPGTATDPFFLLDSPTQEETWLSFPPLPRDANILLVWPRFKPSFWGLDSMMPITPEKAVLPPLSLVTLAALLPPGWRVRLVDCAFEPLTDRDILGAELVMVSAMHAQRADTHEILARCARLGRRTIVGGPYCSSQPEELLLHADHVVAGEVDRAFSQISADFESGRARRLYRIHEKPDVRSTPVPRFDLLQLDKYAVMPIQFCRGCPYQCEFCDIITIYGRVPRTKRPQQVLDELETLYRLGWRKQVFLVDDNFIGNHVAALQLTRDLAQWQRRRNYPVTFYTQASIDLSGRTELLDAMVEAGFLYVFIGIETPSEEALRETKKFQNLRQDTFQQIRTIQRRGLWVTAGFIVGFDSDDERIFDRQLEFIERAAIPWAMVGMLIAAPTTPLFDRLRREGRLIQESRSTTNYDPPNFRTTLPPDILLGGVQRMLRELYRPETYFRRAVRSLAVWHPRRATRFPGPSFWYRVRVVLKSVFYQGLRSSYRRHYWRFLATLLRRWPRDPARLWLGFIILLSAHHFLAYSMQVVAELERSKEPGRPIPGG